MKILVIEDDPAIAGGIVRGLRAAGFEVELANDGKSGAKAALDAPPDLVVLDLMLPERSGFAVLEQLQHRASCPVIVLTARAELEDRLRCFELGAADYMTKPFWIEELVARIKTRLNVRERAPERRIRFDGVVIDLDARSVNAGGAPIELTKHELDLLVYLVERPGQAITRRQLAEKVLSPEQPPEDRTVDSHVARIRKKLGVEAAARIATVWGIGYRFSAEEK